MKLYHRNNFLVVEMPEFVSPEGVDSLQQTLGASVKQIGQKCIISLENVKNLYSAMVRVLVFLYHRLHAYRGTMYIVDADDTVRRAFAAIGFDKTVRIYSTMLEFEIEHDLLACRFTNSLALDRA
jgi:anti-anti-sigma factor